MTLKPEKDKARRIHSKRSKRARSTDEALTAKRKARTYEEWKKDPSRSDIIGVDTPKKSSKTAKTKPKEPTKKKTVETKPKKTKKKRLSLKQKTAIIKRKEDEKRYRFSDSVRYLTNDPHPGPNDFVVVKTVETSIDRMTRYNEPRTLVMRTWDSKLYQIGTDELTRKGIPAKNGQKFTLKRRSKTGYDEDMKQIYTKIE